MLLILFQYEVRSTGIQGNQNEASKELWLVLTEMIVYPPPRQVESNDNNENCNRNNQNYWGNRENILAESVYLTGIISCCLLTWMCSADPTAQPLSPTRHIKPNFGGKWSIDRLIIDLFYLLLFPSITQALPPLRPFR